MANINNIDIEINEDDKKNTNDKSKETELTKKKPKSSGKMRKRVSAMMAARHFFHELEVAAQKKALSKRHDPHFWEEQLKLFDLSQCYKLHQSSAIRMNKNTRQTIALDHQSSIEQHKLLYEYYDLTHTRISRLFNSFDDNNSGVLTLNEFIVGLARHGILPEHRYDTSDDNSNVEKEEEGDKDTEYKTMQQTRNSSSTSDTNKTKDIIRKKSSRMDKVADFSNMVTLAKKIPEKQHIVPKFDERHFRRLLQTVDSDDDNQVDREEFVMVLQGLKMSMLLDTDMAKKTREMLLPDDEDMRNLKVNISVIDYSPHAVFFNSYPISDEDLKKVMFGAKNDTFVDMTWISISPDHGNKKCGIDPITILRFAVKYRLHPLAIHDAMTVGAQRPKVNEYNGDFFFVILPTFRLTKKSMDEWKKATKIKSDKILENDRNRTMHDPNEDSDNEEHEDDEDLLMMSDKDIFGPEPLRVRVEVQQIGLFVMGRKPFDVLMSIEEGWHPFHVHYEQPSGIGTSAIKKQNQREYRRSGMFNSIVQDLGNDFSFSRQGNSLHLMYTMIQKSVEELESVTGAFRTRLGWFQVMLQIEEWQLERKYIRRLLSTQRELDKLIQISRPCTSVMKHLISIMESEKLKDMNEDHRMEIKTYLEDLLDQFEMTMEDLRGLSSLCKSYYIEYDTYQDQRQNRVLYTLTIVTILFLPLQTMTGCK